MGSPLLVGKLEETDDGAGGDIPMPMNAESESALVSPDTGTAFPLSKKLPKPCANSEESTRSTLHLIVLAKDALTGIIFCALF